MRTFKRALWDGSDPTYAPCIGRSDGLFYWRAPPKYREYGYNISAVRLAGEPGDGQDLARAAKCRELTREMLRWHEVAETRLTPGSWGALIARYKSDAVSPIKDVEPNTRASYLANLAYWDPVLSKSLTSAMTFVEAKTIVRAMQEKGRSAHFIKAKFTMLRMVANYGKALRWPGIDDVCAVLGQLKLKSPKPRSSSPTFEQISAIVAAADAAGDAGFALGVLTQWHLSLRAMDVRGDFFEGIGGITRGSTGWGKGLTWAMIDRDITTLSKTPTKTEDKLPEEIVWDLTMVPDVRQRLLDVPSDKRVGPVIVDSRGMPFDRFSYSKLWRKHRTTAGVPEDILMMDTRAGAANDAEEKGATAIEINKQLNHASLETTKRYIRRKSDGVNNVLRLRAEHK